MTIMTFVLEPGMLPNCTGVEHSQNGIVLIGAVTVLALYHHSTCQKCILNQSR